MYFRVHCSNFFSFTCSSYCGGPGCSLGLIHCSVITILCQWYITSVQVRRCWNRKQDLYDSLRTFCCPSHHHPQGEFKGKCWGFQGARHKCHTVINMARSMFFCVCSDIMPGLGYGMGDSIKRNCFVLVKKAFHISRVPPPHISPESHSRWSHWCCQSWWVLLPAGRCRHWSHFGPWLGRAVSLCLPQKGSDAGQGCEPLCYCGPQWAVSTRSHCLCSRKSGTRSPKNTTKVAKLLLLWRCLHRHETRKCYEPGKIGKTNESKWQTCHHSLSTKWLDFLAAFHWHTYWIHLALHSLMPVQWTLQKNA